MTTIKTQDLTGAALDWSVAKALHGKAATHVEKTIMVGHYLYSPSTDWSQGGPLIEQHRVKVAPIRYSPNKDQWLAGIHYFDNSGNPQYLETTGISALNAACRAVVAAKLGDEVDVPEELV